MVVIGVISAVAAIYAVFERESGRALGWSSVSQLGIAILSPTYACIYAMQHGIRKALLFSTLRSGDQAEVALVLILVMDMGRSMSLPFTCRRINRVIVL